MKISALLLVILLVASTSCKKPKSWNCSCKHADSGYHFIKSLEDMSEAEAKTACDSLGLGSFDTCSVERPSQTW